MARPRQITLRQNIAGTRITWFPSPSKALQSIIEQQLTLLLDFEKIDHSLLLIGDWYSARVYRLIIDEFYLDEWKAAVSNKLDQDPEVGSLMKRVREEILVQAVKRKLLRDNPITDDDVKKRFEKEVEETHKTEYKVRHILVKEEAEARDIMAQLDKGVKFDKLAKDKSIDAQSGKNGGELGWVNQGMVVPEFFNAVMAMKKGALSAEPVKSDFGWHIIKVEDARSLKIPTFEQFMSDQRARANIYRKMQDDKVGNLVKDLKGKAKITVN